MADIRLHNVDCMEFMKGVKDKAYDLAIVDPPYGIGRDGGESGKNWKRYDKKKWDEERPGKNYFDELFRVSLNQIVWGGNYFTEYLPSSMGWIFWDKGQELTMSDGELAFSSFEKALRKKTINRCKISDYGGFIHPTQKPVALYKWILKNYANSGDAILDTHGGSMSIAIAAYDLGFDLDVCELDPDYFKAGQERLDAHIAKYAPASEIPVTKKGEIKLF